MPFKATVFHIPHASPRIPLEDRGVFIPRGKALADQVLQMTDHYTDELFNLPDSGVKRVIYPVSRLVVDPERFIDDAREPMAARGMGVIYENTADPLYVLTTCHSSILLKPGQ